MKKNKKLCKKNAGKKNCAMSCEKCNQDDTKARYEEKGTLIILFLNFS